MYRYFFPVVSLSLFSVACESMAPSGHPFTPVSTQASQPSEAPPKQNDDWQFPPEEPAVVPLEQEDTTTLNEPTVRDQDLEVQVEPAAPLDVSAPERAVVSTSQQGSAPATTGWPLRLVATVPGAQPPRAILGLPDGKELVVSAGTMIPSANIVVVAVGQSTVDLAQIIPAGDHAVIRSQTLLAQQ